MRRKRTAWAMREALCSGRVRWNYAHRYHAYFARGLYSRQIECWLHHTQSTLPLPALEDMTSPLRKYRSRLDFLAIPSIRSPTLGRTGGATNQWRGHWAALTDRYRFRTSNWKVTGIKCRERNAQSSRLTQLPERPFQEPLQPRLVSTAFLRRGRRTSLDDRASSTLEQAARGFALNAAAARSLGSNHLAESRRWQLASGSETPAAVLGMFNRETHPPTR